MPKALPVRAVPKGVVLQVPNLVDIGGKPTAALVDTLLRSATDANEKCRLAQIRQVLPTPGGPGSRLREAVDAGGCDLLRLLDAFPSCSLNIFELLCVAQPPRPRYYSVSSCPEIQGAGVAHLTVGLDAAPVPGETERTFYGTGSGYLHRLRPGDRLTVFLASADGFHLQDDAGAPMIFVSAGTGFAPHAGVPLGAACIAPPRRPARRSGAVQRAAVTPDRRTLRRGGRPLPSRSVLDHVHIVARGPARAPRVRAGPSPPPRLSRVAPAFRRRATCTCAAAARCGTGCGPPSSMWSPSTPRCPAPEPKHSLPTWRTPDATDLIYGPEPAMSARRGPRFELRDASLQAYLSRSDSADDRPVRWLAGWALVDSEPNEVVTAKLMITPRAFEHWHGAVHSVEALNSAELIGPQVAAYDDEAWPLSSASPCA